MDMSLLGAKIDHPIDPGRYRLQTEGETLEVEAIWSDGETSGLRFIDVSEGQRHRLIARLYLANRTAPLLI
ncbi:MAG TPA: hypothetical protein VFP23_10135, partial [Solirubrobacterales bacterium]|nr:hypothetical protein [Solirubrobacterales bacterium]